MKRLFVVISSLLVLPAFAEVLPQYLPDNSIEFDDEFVVVPEETQQAVEEPVAEQTTPTSNAKPVNTVQNKSARTTTSARGRTTRGSTTQVSTRGTATRTNSVLGRSNVSSRNNAVTSRNTNTQRAVTARAANLRGSGSTLYNPNARVSTRSSAISFSSNNGVSTNTRVTPTNTTNELDELAEMTDYCKAQYAACMDNYCNVLDDNEGRCSCSANITNYAKTEEALNDATEALQDVAQQIQYIGLSAEDIDTLFTETEAEARLSTSSDSTQLKTNLDKIKRMTVDVKSGTASSSASTGSLNMDLSGLLDFSFDNTGFDLSSFMTTANTANTSSISNQRGANLYKTASARCKASVLNSCSNQGVDPSIITNAYDLQIDKACMAYERNLKDANIQMESTVRNAKSVLQKARLMVAQNKNQYDLRGCVEALDSCMRSDFVCGSNYENCLDPTGKYIVNGEIVVGSEPMKTNNIGLYATWKFDSDDKYAWGDDSDNTLANYINKTMPTSPNNPISKTSDKMSEFLQYKIGYHNNTDNRNYGMCISVLNQCQNYTYKNTGNQTPVYQPNNMVITEYLNRIMPQIKASQDNLLAEYAENCLNDVNSCLSTNNYDSSQNTAINACKKQITTCMSVNATPGEEINLLQWVRQNINVPKCDTGKYYDWNDGACKNCSNAPQHAVYSNNGGSGINSCTWVCDTGYKKTIDGTGCEAESGN